LLHASEHNRNRRRGFGCSYDIVLLEMSSYFPPEKVFGGKGCRKIAKNFRPVPGLVDTRVITRPEGGQKGKYENRHKRTIPHPGFSCSPKHLNRSFFTKKSK
jgi:hypothetical protein